MSRIIVVQEGQDVVVTSGPQFGVKYVLIGPDGSRAVLNDPGDPDYVGHISDMTGMDSPDVRESADDLIGDDGGIHGEFFYGRRPITMTGMIDNRPAPHHYEVIPISRISTNYARNPQFSAGTLTDWAAVSSSGFTLNTFESSRDWADTGDFSLHYKATKDATVTSRTMGVTSTPGVNGIRMGAGVNLTMRAAVYVTTALANGIRLRLTYYDQNGGTINVQSGAYVIGTGVKKLESTFTTPANTAFVSISVSGDSTTSGSVHEFFLDSVQLMLSSEVVDFYFGGNTFVNAVPYMTQQNSDGSSHLYLSERSNFSSNRVRNLRMTKLSRVTNATRKDMSMRWQPDGGVEQTVNVRRQQPLRFSGAFNKEFMLSLVSADHRIYDVQTKEYSVSPGTTTDLVLNNGTTSTPAAITIYGPATNPVITNFTTGESLSLTYTIPAGSYVSLDFANRTAMLNGTTNIYSAVVFGTSVWWQIHPGQNNIRWTAGSTTSDSRLRVEWRDAWI